MHARKIADFFAIALFFLLVSLGLAQTENYSLTPAGHIGGEVNGGLVVGNYVYLSQGGYLTVLEDNPDEFRQVASLFLRGEAVQFVASGNYLFSREMNVDSALHVIDISDPLHPADVAFLSVPLRKLAIMGHHLIIAAADSGLWVVDIADPTHPQISGNLRTFKPVDVAVSGNYAFTLDAENGKLRVVDVSNPASPTAVADVDVASAGAIAVQGDYAYLAVHASPNSGLQIVDISDPLHPALAGFVKSQYTEGNTSYLKSPLKVAVDGDRAYLGCMGGGSFLFSFDVSDANNPTVLGHLALRGGTALGSMQIKGSLAYVIHSTGNVGLETVDVSDPANLSPGKVFERPTNIRDLSFIGDTILIKEPGQLWVFDVSDPAAPVQRAIFSEWAGLSHMHQVGQMLIAVKGNEVVLLDISDLNAITQIASYKPASGTPVELFVNEHYIYILVSDNVNRFEIIDISDQNNPALVGSTDIRGRQRALGVSADGELAFVAYYKDDSDQGFQIFDLSNPANPQLLSTTQTAKKPLAIAVTDSAVFVGSNNGWLNDAVWVLEKYDITNPASPVKTAETGGNGSIWNADVVGDVVLAGIQGHSVYMALSKTLMIVGVCHSHGTIQMITGPAKSSSTGAMTGLVATNDGFGNHNYKDGYGYQGVPLQKFTVHKTQKPNLTRIKVDPPDTTVHIGNPPVTFTATGKDAKGNTVAIPNPEWSVNGGGTIVPNGQECTFTPTAVGTWTLTCRDKDSGITGSASITIEDVALASIDVSPANANMNLADPQPIPFTAMGKDAKGNAASISKPKWSVSGGGLIVPDNLRCLFAPAVPGRWEITCADEKSGISGSAQITVQDASPGRIARMEIKPKEARTGVGGKPLLFYCSAKDARGNPVRVQNPEWTVDGGGNLERRGQVCKFTPQKAGVHWLRCKDPASGKSAQTPISVLPVETEKFIIKIIQNPSWLKAVTSGPMAEVQAIGKDDQGNTVPINDPQWSTNSFDLEPDDGKVLDLSRDRTLRLADDGLILYPDSQRCKIKPVNPGGFFVICTDGSTGNFGFTVVEVYDDVLDSIVISPVRMNLEVGDTAVVFRATGLDSSGQEAVIPAPEWSVTGGGTIVPDGRNCSFFPMANGTWQITCRDTLMKIVGSATIVVGPVSAVQEKSNVPGEFSLGQNYPNPFNPETTIRFHVAQACHVELVVYDVHGRTVARLVDREYTPGSYETKLKATGLPSGLYVYKIKMGGFQAMKKMLLLK